MKTTFFKHNWVKTPKLTQVNSTNGRHYEIDQYKLPSITTVLSKTKDYTTLNEWKRKVGYAEADRIMKEALANGTEMHRLCEKFLLNRPFNDIDYSIKDTDSTNNDIWIKNQKFYESDECDFVYFKTIKPALEKLDNIRALEKALFSQKLAVAGTVDCIAEYDGELSIIDFKSSSKPKREEWIEDYYLQGCFYFTSFYELTGELPKNVIIMIAVSDGTYQQFVLRNKDIIHYTKRLLQRIDTYYKMIGEKTK